jgi:hypothetical protein
MSQLAFGQPDQKTPYAPTTPLTVEMAPGRYHPFGGTRRDRHRVLGGESESTTIGSENIQSRSRPIPAGVAPTFIFGTP